MAPMLPVELLLISSLFLPAVTSNPVPRTIPISRSAGQTIPLYRSAESIRRRSDEQQLRRYAEQEANYLRDRSRRNLEKRDAFGYTIPLENLHRDTEYFGTVYIGTPAMPFSVAFDTGSSDLWLAGANCTNCAPSIPIYDAAESSTSVVSTENFSITYGSGTASGVIVSDKVSLGNYTIDQQVFGSCTIISNGLLLDSLSGLMGLAFQRLATSGAMPFWQAAGINEMSFALSRYLHDLTASTTEPGGFLTLEGINDTLYEGNITYHELAQETYWLLESSGVYVDGVAIEGTASKSVAIDTGTSLLGGPAEDVANVYAKIPGAFASPIESYSGYYQYPCDAEFNISVAFGGIMYPIWTQDFNLGTVTGANGSVTCLGALFVLGQSTPQWLIGGTFLKSYYTVFRADPPSVGFATLRNAEVEAVMYSSGSIQERSLSTDLVLFLVVGYLTMYFV